MTEATIRRDGYTTLHHPRLSRSRSRAYGTLLVLCAIAALSTLLALSPAKGGLQRRADERLPRNVQLLQTHFVQPLRRGEPLKVGVVGGSISHQPGAFGSHLIPWLNRAFPPSEGKHELVNRAISASESGVTSICLGTLFHFFADQDEPDARPPIDLLLVEFAYNDGALTTGEEGRTGFQISRTADYERIFRTALAWPVPVMVVEVAGFEGDLKSDFDAQFLASSGADHAPVAEHYGVPIVDFARFLFTIPDLPVATDLFRDQGIHPGPKGNSVLAGLVAREILFHVQLADNDTVFVEPKGGRRGGYPGPSWPLRAAGDYHGLPPPERIPATALETLSPLPPPRWQLGETFAWECVSSQIEHTLPRLVDSVRSSKEWEYGTDPSDGGPTRMRSRPGYFVVDASHVHLVFEVDGRHSRTALLYRRSWQRSADALVWVDEDPSDSLGPDERGQIAHCPAKPVRLKGHWTQRSTQMVLAEVCPGDEAWSRRRAGGKSFLHVVTTDAEGEGAGTYFKSYGYAVS